MASNNSIFLKAETKKSTRTHRYYVKNGFGRPQTMKTTQEGALVKYATGYLTFATTSNLLAHRKKN